MNKKINIIVAHDRNNGIGKDGNLLFKSKTDMSFFKSMTLHSCVIMGRKTWESLPGKLKSRKNVVISKNSNYDTGDERVSVYTSLEDAIDDNLDRPIFIAGGESIYKEAIEKKLITGIYKTVFNCKKEADTFFQTYVSNKRLKHLLSFEKNEDNECSGNIYVQFI